MNKSEMKKAVTLAKSSQTFDFLSVPDLSDYFMSNSTEVIEASIEEVAETLRSWCHLRPGVWDEEQIEKILLANFKIIQYDS